MMSDHRRWTDEILADNREINRAMDDVYPPSVRRPVIADPPGEVIRVTAERLDGLSGR